MDRHVTRPIAVSLAVSEESRDLFTFGVLLALVSFPALIAFFNAVSASLR